MAINYLDTVDFNNIPVKNLVPEKLSSPPSSPAVGRTYFDTTLGKVGSYNGTSWDYSGSGGVQSLAVTVPLVSTGGNNPTISITPASGASAGSLSSSDFTKLANATPNNTASTIVMRDSSGNVIVGTITGNLTGTASNASNLNSQLPSFYLGRTNHTGTQLSNTISDFDTQVRISRLDQFASPTSAVSLNNQRITGLATPSVGSDAASRDFVESLVATGTNKGTVRAASTSNINLSAPGSAIDGVVLTNGNLFAAFGQTDGTQNALYVFNGAAIPATRTTNADTTAEVTSGLFVFVSEGTVNGSNGFTLVTPNPIVLGTTALTFVQTSGAGQITAGSGLVKSGNILNVATNANSGIVVNADDIAIDSTLVSTKYTQAIGDGTSTTITVTHGRNNPNAGAVVRQTLTPFERVFPTERNPTANTMSFTFFTAPTANQYTVQIQG